ncbi:head GIN domain-containing protein [Geofilum rubicundum]|nr:head GIN domain-containing protein [Geofilum rubicundum]
MKQTKGWITLLGLVWLLSSCVYAGSEGIQKETRKLAPFSEVKVSTGVQLFLTQGDENMALVEADGSIIDNVVVESKNGVLEIYYKSTGWNLFGRNLRHGEIKVLLTFTRLEKLKASSGSSVHSQHVLNLGDFDLSASSGANSSLELSARRVSMDASSGANVKVKGTADSIYAEASSGANVKASDFVALAGAARASSGGSVKIYVDGDVDARASSGGSITVFGDAALRNVEQSSGGSVNTR